MRKIKSFFGYTWAVLAMLIALATFLGQMYFSRTLAEATGIRVHPRYSGGEVASVIDHGVYSTSVHQPVFDALIGQTSEGFVQINWSPAGGLPAVIREEIDCNSDGRKDFTVTLNTSTGEATLIKNDPAVIGLQKTYRLRDGWAVRVQLRR
jgi:hypothetical protein